MKLLLWMLCAITGPWLLLGGVAGLCFGLAVQEALVLEVAGLGLVLLAGVLLIDDIAGPRT